MSVLVPSPPSPLSPQRGEGKPGNFPLFFLPSRLRDTRYNVFVWIGPAVDEYLMTSPLGLELTLLGTVVLLLVHPKSPSPSFRRSCSSVKPAQLPR